MQRSAKSCVGNIIFWKDFRNFETSKFARKWIKFEIVRMLLLFSWKTFKLKQEWTLMAKDFHTQADNIAPSYSDKYLLVNLCYAYFTVLCLKW